MQIVQDFMELDMKYGSLYKLLHPVTAWSILESAVCTCDIQVYRPRAVPSFSVEFNDADCFVHAAFSTDLLIVYIGIK